jgi:hypothetical protein
MLDRLDDLSLEDRHRGGIEFAMWDHDKGAARGTHLDVEAPVRLIESGGRPTEHSHTGVDGVPGGLAASCVLASSCVLGALAVSTDVAARGR